MKILGLDLGTNSIGWIIRDPDVIQDSQIIDYGVIIFRKGVGEGESGEFSLAAERRGHRSKRRLYNAKRYRKWELLKILIDSKMCPLKMNELRLWSIGNWELVDRKKKNLGRVYPLGNTDFLKWLAFDPEYFGNKGTTEKGNPIRKNPYDIRCELTEKFEGSEKIRKYRVGRALYHLVQRRGFRSSRKSGKSTYAENKDIEQRKTEEPDFQIATLAKEKLDNGERFRASGVIQRKYFEDEFYAICKKQGIGADLIKRLHKAIYFVRPLRTQKGLVGACTLEKGKPRIPDSHPKFQEFRALSFINNIQWREVGNKNFEPIPILLKRRILEELFFRRIERGANKGKVSIDGYFKFDEIINRYSEKGKCEFNYKNKPNVSTCPVIAGLMNVFDEEWRGKFIQDENAYGINWEGLELSYEVKYGKKKGQKRSLKIDEMWHLLFDYVLTKDKKDELKNFCKSVLTWNDKKTETFTSIDIPQGYGSLSYAAISKILPFLRQGFIYSEAVSFANLKKVLGGRFEIHKKEARQMIVDTIKDVDAIKEKLQITNGLIQQFFAGRDLTRGNGIDNHAKEMAYENILTTLKSYFGEKEWTSKQGDERKKYESEISNFYLKFLEGKQREEEKASAGRNMAPKRDYYKLPRLDEAIKRKLKVAFTLSDERLNHLYRPSDIEIYDRNSVKEIKVRIDGVETRIKQLGSPQPPSRGWKNPMAMRTMYELRKLLNYLLRVGKIDSETKIVVEMARELNDANRRWAIETYQRQREEENIEFAKAIVGVAKEKYPSLDESSVDNVNKVRLWWEQLENGEEIYKQVKALKEDVQKYRLWKEQECQCMYTGKTINLTDLFDGSKINIEHTLPISDSFDNSLANKTIAYSFYNQQIKRDLLPTQLDNYSKDANGYTAIESRIKTWKERVSHLNELITDNKTRTKKTIDPETKKSLIQRRRLLELEFEYWDKKLRTFTLTEIPRTWKNSQLVDTQIITKYSRAYLKTVFNKVDAQKAIIVNDFKKIFQIRGDEQKDRGRHGHHALDAAVLALIPGSAKRDAILKEYYRAEEHRHPYDHPKPYITFQPSHVLKIESEILINHVIRSKIITNTSKKIKKRGEIVFLRDKKTKQYPLDENNKKIPLIATGDTIRGQINDESYLGAILPPERDNEGLAFKTNGKWKVKTNKEGKPEIWIVKRLPIHKVDLKKDVIIDEPLKGYIVRQVENGISTNEVVDFGGKKIRHLRCRVKTGRGFQSVEKTIELKKHSHLSNKSHKQYMRSKIAENFLCLFYENKGGGKPLREVRILSLFGFRGLGFSSLKEFYQNPEWGKIKKDGEVILSLTKIIRVGQRVLFYEHSMDELTRLSKDELYNRLFTVYKFNEVGTPYIYLQNHLEARPEEELEKLEKKKDGFTEFDKKKYQYRLKLKANKMNCAFEGKYFEIKPDGQIIFR